jgi:hypothetical protein
MQYAYGRAAIPFLFVRFVLIFEVRILQNPKYCPYFIINIFNSFASKTVASLFLTVKSYIFYLVSLFLPKGRWQPWIMVMVKYIINECPFNAGKSLNPCN